MQVRSSLIAIVTAVAVLSGCSVFRKQETVGEFVDDAKITTMVKAKMLENKDVAGTAISVETMNGTVQLSGFAKSASEKSTAESLARGIKGVKSVRNDIIVRP